MLTKVLAPFAKVYKSVVASRLAAVGLKYDDLMIEGGDLSKALSRTSPDIVEDRHRRIKRAFDLTSKRKQMPGDSRADDPMNFYIGDKLEHAVNEREEREALNKY
jgi:ubiquinol-cytochrome c reductase subunit 7